MRFSRSNDDNIFFTLFTKQATFLVSAAELLAKISAATPERRVDLRDELHRLEQSCDEVTHEIAERLNQTFVTPLDRDDITYISSRLDDCMDYICLLYTSDAADDTR